MTFSHRLCAAGFFFLPTMVSAQEAIPYDQSRMTFSNEPSPEVLKLQTLSPGVMGVAPDAVAFGKVETADWVEFNPLKLPQDFEFTTLKMEQLGTGEGALAKALKIQTNAVEEAARFTLFPTSKKDAGLQLLNVLQKLPDDELTSVVANIAPCEIVICPPFGRDEVVGLAIKVGERRREERAAIAAEKANEIAVGANTNALIAIAVSALAVIVSLFTSVGPTFLNWVGNKRTVRTS